MKGYVQQPTPGIEAGLPTVAMGTGDGNGATATPIPLDTSTIVSQLSTRYFLIKSFNNDNLGRSLQYGVWATSQRNERVLHAAYQSAAYVVLIFSVNHSSRFAGFGLMSSAPGESKCKTRSIFCGPDGSPFPGRLFDVLWIAHCEVFFREVEHIPNSFNENKSVKIGRDGQEIDPQAGRVLCEMLQWSQHPQPRGRQFQTHEVHRSFPLSRSPVETTSQKTALLPPPPTAPLASSAGTKAASCAKENSHPQFSVSLDQLAATGPISTTVPSPKNRSTMGKSSSAAFGVTSGPGSSSTASLPVVSPHSTPSLLQTTAQSVLEKEGNSLGGKRPSVPSRPFHQQLAAVARILKAQQQQPVKQQLGTCPGNTRQVPEGGGSPSVDTASQVTTSESIGLLPPSTSGSHHPDPEVNNKNLTRITSDLDISQSKPLTNWDFEWAANQVFQDPALAVFPVDLTQFEEYESYLGQVKKSRDLLFKVEEDFRKNQRRMPELPPFLQIPSSLQDCFSVEVLLELLATVNDSDPNNSGPQHGCVVNEASEQIVSSLNQVANRN